MAFNPNTLLIDRSKSVFVTLETTAGTPALPSANEFILLNDFPSYDQQQDTTNVSTLRNSRTTTDKIFNNFSFGTFSGVSISARPSGTAGTKPTLGESNLLEAALGHVTDSTTSGVSAVVITGGTQGATTVYNVASHGFRVGDTMTVSGDGDATYNVADQLVTAVTATTITTNLNSTGAGAAPAASGSPVTSIALTRYTLCEELPYFTMWFFTETGISNCDGGGNVTGGRVLECLAGCQISSMSIEIAKDGELQYSFDGEFQRRYISGPSVTDAITSNGATTISIDSAYSPAELYFVGQQVQILHVSGTETMTGGATISAVNASSITVGAVTLSGDMPVGSIVIPYHPTGVISGSVLAQRNAVACFAASDTAYGTDTGDILESTTPGSGFAILATSASINLSQNLQKPTEKELTGNAYPSAQFILENREISGEMMLVFRLKDQNYYEAIANTPNRAYCFRVGDTKGSIIDAYMPRAFTDVPVDSQDNGARIQTFEFETIEPTAGVERELTIYYR